MIASIFNDVVGPIMRGPSSSHCAGALRIGRMARDLMASELREVLVEFDRNGSLATTHESQGSDMGLFAGLLGWDASDERLPKSQQAVRDAAIQVSIAIRDTNDPHPNTFRLTLCNGPEQHVMHAVSTGGGMIEVIAVDGFTVSFSGDCHTTLLWTDHGGSALVDRLKEVTSANEIVLHEAAGRQLVEVRADRFINESTLAELRQSAGIRQVRRLNPVLPILSRRDIHVPFTTCAEMLRYGAGRNRLLWQLAMDYETARGNLTEQDVMARMRAIVGVMQGSVGKGIAGTHYADRLLGYQCGRFKELMGTPRLLDCGVLNRILLYVSALMEAKSAMEVIVAAPTAGASAAFPACVLAVAEESNRSEEDMAKAMLAGGIIGVFIATHWTFAAEAGGCQAENGSASSMAAAALVTLADGSLAQAVAAASMALQNTLGLVCDPVAGRVEVPCLGRNVMAASNALACANLALADYDPIIPLDQVIAAARGISELMPRELRCTALGGLSVTPAARAAEQYLAERRSGGCTNPCGHAARGNPETPL